MSEIGRCPAGKAAAVNRQGDLVDRSVAGFHGGSDLAGRDVAIDILNIPAASADEVGVSGPRLFVERGTHPGHVKLEHETHPAQPIKSAIHCRVAERRLQGPGASVNVAGRRMQPWRLGSHHIVDEPVVARQPVGSIKRHRQSKIRPGGAPFQPKAGLKIIVTLAIPHRTGREAPI